MLTAAQIRSAVYASIPIMPAELCGLITELAGRRSHSFNAGRLTGLASCTVGPQETELTVDDRSTENRWHSFVSETMLADGDYEWNVDFAPSANGWIGVGMTTSKTNCLSKPDKMFDFLASKNDWILVITAYDCAVFHGTQVSTIWRFPKQRMDVRRRVWFRADPTTGVVTARYGPTDDGIIDECDGYDGYDDYYSDDVKVSQTAIQAAANAEPRPSFAQLRPCVVIAGSISAVVRSGPAVPADYPADWQELPIVSST